MTAPQPPKTYGDQSKTAEQISGMSASQRQDYIENQMSPAARSEYFQAQASAVGDNGPWFTGMIERMQAELKAGQISQQMGQSNVQQATSGNTQYVTGLQPSNTDYKGINHPELAGYVDNGLDAGQVGQVSDAYHQMSSAFDQFATTLGAAVNKSQGDWEGTAAESARGYFTSLQKWADANSQNSKLASEVVYQQSTSASTAKNSMPAPVPFSWTDEMKSWAGSNPFNLVDNINASLQKQQQSQDAHDQAAHVLSTYDSQLYSAASKQPVFAEPPKFEATAGGAVGPAVSSIGGTASSAYTGPAGGNIGASGGSGHLGATGAPAGGSSGSLSGSLAGLTGGGYTPPLNSGAKTGAGGVNVGTSAQGYQPGNNYNSSTSSGPGSTGLGAMGGMPMGAMGGGLGGAGGGEEYSSKLGRGGSGFGPGGSGSGSSSGSAAGSGSAGSGAQSGARAGGAGAAETAAGSGRGSAGASGRGGMSGMGHGGKGEGGEDDEHQRPSWLIEPDPDEIFGTNERTAPPVIGE
jgi:hypothetical protein